MKPLMELSASLDTYRPNSAALFRSLSANSKSDLVANDGKIIIIANANKQNNFTGFYDIYVHYYYGVYGTFFSRISKLSEPIKLFL